MTLGEQSPEDERQFPAESEERHRGNKQQQTEYQRNPAVRLRNSVPLELSYRKPMPREHGTNQRIDKQMIMDYLINSFLVQSILPSVSKP